METGRRSWWPWALLGGLAFVVVAVRTLGETGPTFLQGDLALLHVDSLRAAGLHQLLGPYDRFGWHHPGPAYAYLISIADRVVGFRHPLQAEALTALAINSVSLAAAAAVARRHLGPGAAVGILALGWLAVVDLGNDAVFNPWSPTVVVLPTLLVGVLALAAVVSRPRAAGVADGMALLVGALLMLTFCLQSDLGTLPFVAPAVAVIVSVTVAVPLARRWPSVPSSEPTARPAPARWARSWIAVLTAGALITVAAWIPVLVQQWWSDQGNLTRIIRFFTAGHHHAGLAAGIRAAGWAQLAVFGRRPPGAPPVGGDGSWAALGVVLGAAVLLALGVGRRRPALMAGAAFWLVGTGLAVLAGAEIVGPPYSYLTVGSPGTELEFAL